MIISTKAEKAFEKKLICFCNKNCQQIKYRRNVLDIIKAIYDKSTANIMLNSENLKYFPLRSGIRKKKKLILITSIEHNTGSFHQRSQPEKEIKGIHIGKEEAKLPYLQMA